MVFVSNRTEALTAEMKIRLLDLAGEAEESFEPTMRGGEMGSLFMGPLSGTEPSKHKPLLRERGP